MEERLKELRKALNLNQAEFSKRLNLGHSTWGMIEVGKRNLNDRHIKLICSEFNVSEEWLRNGKGEMFVQPETFSLDEYAGKKGLSPLELDIIKGYMELDSNIRETIMSHFKSIFDRHSEIAATKENYINDEVEKYRLELEAEQKGEMSSALDATKEKLG